jgi:microcin C transport system substrate-binding protein
MTARALAFASALLIAGIGAAAAQTGPSHGLSLFGELKYAPDFKHLDYANPDAPKGGTVKLATIGTYDSFNPFILRGTSAAGIGSLFDTLMTRTEDEMSTLYCVVCETVELAPDRTTLTFVLRKEARFQDGTPITPDDVLWTFETLKAKGHPQYRFPLGDIAKGEKVDDRTVRFTLKDPNNREAPLYVGELPILSKAYWATRDFEKTTLDPPLGSGPYKVESFEPGRSITYTRIKDYWAKDLPIRRGTSNFEAMRYDYYRDRGVSLEAFKAGQYDYREEFTSKDWATGYDTPAVRDGLIKKEEIKHEIPQGMQGVIYNLRRPIFQDARVRRALGYAFDFEWMNKTLFYGAYTRTDSYFANSVFASHGLPEGKEKELLEQYRGKIPEEVFTTVYQTPRTDGSGNIRDNIREGLKLLKEAGWGFKGKQLVNDKTGEPFVFEVLNYEPTSERIILPFKANLERMGITLNLRNVDPTQYQNRVRDFDFDAISGRLPSSFPPGNELQQMFTSEAAKANGSFNYGGVADPAVDQLVATVMGAHKMDDLIVAARALDRVMLHNYFVTPEWYIGAFRIAYWTKFGRPETTPKYASGFDTWWIDPAREGTVQTRKEQTKTP